MGDAGLGVPFFPKKPGALATLRRDLSMVAITTVYSAMYGSAHVSQRRDGTSLSLDSRSYEALKLRRGALACLAPFIELV